MIALCSVLNLNELGLGSVLSDNVAIANTLRIDDGLMPNWPLIGIDAVVLLLWTVVVVAAFYYCFSQNFAYDERLG